MNEPTKLVRVVKQFVTGRKAVVLNEGGIAIYTSPMSEDGADALAKAIEKSVSALLQSERAKVWGEAAKMVCPRCAKGEEPFFRQPNWCHDVFICRADELLRARAREER